LSSLKISILSPDLSHNCLGRAYILAKVLQRRYEVEIVGPLFGDGIWEPVADDKDMPYKFAKLSGRFTPYQQLYALTRQIDGEVVYASKPLVTSFGLGLFKKFLRKRPLILDIDDWQMGFIKANYMDLSIMNRMMAALTSATRVYSMDSYWNALLCEKAVRFADEVTVSNSFLRERFGGTIICHGRDTDSLDPGKYDQNSIKAKYGIAVAKKVVMFFGTPRVHKGIEDLVRAVDLIKDHDLLLVVVGIDESDYSRNVARNAENTLNEKFKSFGLQPFEKVPEFLAMADVVVIPQRRGVGTKGQVPAKIYDAMAMAKPVIATNVSDCPEILDACGWIVEPEAPGLLASTIAYVLDHPQEAERTGQRARQKCAEKYSWNAIEKSLIHVFSKYE
jgi:glycosyltransferase involved in cell wall biosynthesis